MTKRKRETVTVTVFTGEQYDDGWPCPYQTTLVDLISWFEAKLAEIPEEYRNVATCEIDSVRSWEDTHYAQIEISYRRPETDAEMADRLEHEEIARHAHEAKERAMLAALQQKYGEPE